MTTIVGQSIADLNYVTPETNQGKFSDLKGKRIVLYFYPKDNTSGCTQEGQDFSEHYSKFKKLNTEIFGISRDSLKSHSNFKCKFNFPFELISDNDETLCNFFQVMKEKSMYGRKYMGIERSTFLIDENGLVEKEWRNVKVTNHITEVLETIKNLEKKNG